MWIDSHCHLDADGFRTAEGQDERPLVLQRARAAKIAQMIVIGSGKGIHEIENAIFWANQDSSLYAAIGVHPHDAASVVGAPVKADSADIVGEALWKKIEVLANTEPKVVAIGETGLDLFYEHSPISQQIQLFKKFLTLAKQTNKPLSLHVRDAHQEALSLVQEIAGVTGVVHCFTGTVQEAKAWLDLGFFLSFSGIVTFPKATNVQEACRFAPLDRILLETDCPYLAPIPMRGKRNEPAYLVYTAEFVAKLKQISILELAQATSQSTGQLFRLKETLSS